MSSSKAQHGRYLFAFLLFIVAWAPLPMGSNGPWPLWLLNGLIFSLAVLCALQFARGRLETSATLRKAWLPLLLLALVQLWVFVQTLPTSFQATDSWAAHTRLFQGLAYTAFFALVLLLVNSKQRRDR